MTSYFNNNLPLFVSESEINTINNNIAPDSIMNFRGNDTPINMPLIAGSYVPISGADSYELVPTTWDILSELKWQFLGNEITYFIITYNLSGLLDTITEDITFTIAKNNTPRDETTQITNFTPTKNTCISCTSLVRIAPNDIIEIQAKLGGITDDSFFISRVSLMVIKVVAS